MGFPSYFSRRMPAHESEAVEIIRAIHSAVQRSDCPEVQRSDCPEVQRSALPSTLANMSAVDFELAIVAGLIRYKEAGNSYKQRRGTGPWEAQHNILDSKNSNLGISA
jgi:hypothetical protein